MGCGAATSGANPGPQPACCTPGCGKPTWNGQPGGYCGQKCRTANTPTATGTVVVCLTPGCGKPTWNGRPNEYCSKGCKSSGPVTVVAVGYLCSSGCGKPTWNGQPGGFCSKACTRGMGGQPGTQVSPAKFKDIENQFTSKWDASRGSCPQIKSIWNVWDPQLLNKHDQYCQRIGNVPCFGSGVNPGNRQRRFHCTTMKCVDKFQGMPCNDSSCAVCCIIKTGFLLKFAGKCGSAWGAGIYSSPTPSYANWVKNRRATFVCSVACGVVDMTDTKAALPSGTHSRVASSTTGNPADNELIVFDEAAIVPKYLILF